MGAASLGGGGGTDLTGDGTGISVPGFLTTGLLLDIRRIFEARLFFDTFGDSTFGDLTLGGVTFSTVTFSTLGGVTGGVTFSTLGGDSMGFEAGLGAATTTGLGATTFGLTTFFATLFTGTLPFEGALTNMGVVAAGLGTVRGPGGAEWGRLRGWLGLGDCEGTGGGSILSFFS
jgi:hypothetical protein